MESNLDKKKTKDFIKTRKCARRKNFKDDREFLLDRGYYYRRHYCLMTEKILQQLNRMIPPKILISFHEDIRTEPKEQNI